MKSFLIGGTIIDDNSQQWAFEDVTPSQVRAVLAKLEPAEDITFEISSPGGSVTGGIAIANLIREASKSGHPCKAHVIGIAASMASVIACACDEVDIDESAFMMIHNPWTVAEGDADELRKSADVLDQMKKAILSFYRSKFDKTDEELSALMDAETWFTGADAADFAFACNVIKTGGELKAAACARRLPGFAKCPAAAEHLLKVAAELPPAKEPTAADGSEPSDELPPDGVIAAAPAEVPPEGESAAAPAELPPEGESAAATAEVPPEGESAAATAEVPPADPFAARLAAAMRSRDTEINQLKAKITETQLKAVDVCAKIEREFQDKLEAADKELTAARAEVTRLAADLASAKDELQATASALMAKTQALAELNASVNHPAAVATRAVNARIYMASLPDGQRQAFYREHAKAVDSNQIINI